MPAQRLSTEATRELLIVCGLLIVALMLLLVFFDPEPFHKSRIDDLLTKIAFAILVTVISRLLWLAFKRLEEPDALTSFKDLGMLRIIDPLGDKKLRRRLARAREIRILKTWFPENETIAGGLRSAIKNKAAVRLLLANPDSRILMVRSQGSVGQPDHGKNKVIEVMEKIPNWARDAEQVEVHIGLYDSWPGCPVIWYDDRILMGFYFRGASSPHWPWVEVKKGSKLATILDDQFHSLWDSLPPYAETQEPSLPVHLSSIDQIGQWLEKRKREAAAVTGAPK